MSVFLVADVLRTDLPALDKMVLVVIANRLNDEGQGCWYSVGTIAEMAGLSDRKVREIAKRMEAIHLLRRRTKSGHVNYWEMDPAILARLPKVEARRNPKPHTPAPHAPPQETAVLTAEMAATPAHGAPDPCTARTSTPARGAAKKNIEKKREEDLYTVREGSGEGFCHPRAEDESSEADQFRKAARERLGPALYGKLLARSWVSFADGNIRVHAADEGCRTMLEQRAPLLRKAMREMGGDAGLQILPSSNQRSRAPDPKAADAERQLGAIRDRRAAQVADQAGGLG